MPLESVYGPGDPPGFDPAVKLGEPGRYPFTRGIYPGMYTERPWTIRQYAGFATAQASNRRYQQLIAAGTTGLSVAFDLPTQMGYDSDAPIAHGEVGKVGVAIDSIEDMRTLLHEIPLATVSTSMTINAPAAVLLLLYQLVAEEQGVAASALTGTIQNDILKEYIARGTYIYPPQPSLRLVADTFAYCRREMPRWNTISISGYHMAEAGATPVQEVAFTLANAKEYVRAARRLWARIMSEEFGAADPRSQMLRFHTQTAGVQLTAQQPEVNLSRVTIQALAAVLGGTQSLHTNAYDEAIALPSEKAARLALRTQQVLAHETDLTATADPFAGSYAVESMTDDLEAAASELITRVEDLGGAVAAIERGFQKAEIERSAYRIARQIDDGERLVVGVNKFTSPGEEPGEAYQPLRVDPAIEEGQAERLARLRSARDAGEWQRRITELKKAAAGSQNVLVPLREALRAQATVGEACDALREVWGVYQPAEIT